MTAHHVKAAERQVKPRGSSDRLLVRPVDLRLEAWRGLEALLALRHGARARALDVAAHGVVAALKAVVAREILVHASRQKACVAGEPLVDQRFEGIER
jgi:hypothetical protein